MKLIPMNPRKMVPALFKAGAPWRFTSRPGDWCSPICSNPRRKTRAPDTQDQLNVIFPIFLG